MDEDPDKLQRVARQFRQAIREIKITCVCGFTVPLRFAYRCLYCGEYFCVDCAGVHFGASRHEYLQQKEAGCHDVWP